MTEDGHMAHKNMAMDVMMMLEGDALTQVYTVFKEKNDREDGSGLSQTEFVSAVLKYLPKRYLLQLDKVDLVMQLTELFAQVSGWSCHRTHPSCPRHVAALALSYQ